MASRMSQPAVNRASIGCGMPDSRAIAFTDLPLSAIIWRNWSESIRNSIATADLKATRKISWGYMNSC